MCKNGRGTANNCMFHTCRNHIQVDHFLENVLSISELPRKKQVQKHFLIPSILLVLPFISFYTGFISINATIFSLQLTSGYLLTNLSFLVSQHILFQGRMRLMVVQNIDL